MLYRSAMQQLNRWRGFVYWSCAGLVTLGLLQLPIMMSMRSGMPDVMVLVVYRLYGFATLFPMELSSMLGPLENLLAPLVIAGPIVSLALVIRRGWRTIARGERVPGAFDGKLLVLGASGLVALVLAILGTAVQVGDASKSMLFVPAWLCVPWAFLLTEIKTLQRKTAAPPRPTANPAATVARPAADWPETRPATAPAPLAPRPVATAAKPAPDESISAAVLSVFLRGIVAFIAFVVAFGLALLSGLPYGGGEKGLFFLAALVLFGGLGWTLLPALRASRILAIVVAIAWVACALWMLVAGGGMWFVPWALATVGVVMGFVRRPGRWWANRPRSA
jgi:hypothetical protein